jgi:spore germination protein YaaH
VIKKHKTLVFIILFFTLLFSIFLSLKIWQNSLLSPIGKNTQFTYLKNWLWPNNQKEEFIVYGFLPYWNINKVELQPELTHLSYFALEVGADGQIVTESLPGESEPGYRQLNSEDFFRLINDNNITKELVLSQFSSQKIEELLNNPSAWLTLLEQIDALLLAYPFSGLNLDFEYQGEADDQLRQQFVNFIISIKQHLNQREEKINLSIDVYANAGNQSKKLLWDLVALETYLDYVVVMAYDFHRQSSPQAGPGAPLFGGQELWSSDINRLMKGFFDQLPRQKILLGIPFYGYGWQTDSLEPQANTYPSTGFMVSYQESLDLQNLTGRWQNCSNLEIYWQEDALSPFATLICPKNEQKNNDSEEEIESLNYLVYFENTQSLQYKIDYAKQLEIAGVAIWALGYDGDNRNLWDIF